MGKTVLFVRHPSVVWSEDLLRRAEIEGKDVETYVPIDEMGWEMVKCLEVYLSQILCRETFEILTSPLKRAKDMANAIGQRFSVCPIESDLFAEVFFTTNTEYVLALIERAKEQGVHPAKLWFDEEGTSSELLERLNAHLSFSVKGLELLENSRAPVSVVFSHRVAIALMLWLIQKRDGLTITEEDIPAISMIGGKIAYTSVSQIELGVRGWDIVSIGQVPHLKGKPHLVRGTF